MNKSFKQRLEALEALETRAAATAFDGSALDSADRELLYMAISVYAATLDDRGHLVRAREYGDTAALDRAIARCNAALAALVPRLTTIEDVDRWVRDLDDPDSFDEDELLSWVHYGLAKKPPAADFPAIEHNLHFTTGGLCVSVSFPGALLGHWTRIAERARPLLKERGIVFFPLFSEDARAALALLDSGLLKCRPLHERAWKSHHTTISLSYNSDVSSDTRALYDRLVWALDQLQIQTGAPFIETAEELRADLVAALEDSDHVPLQETA